MTRRAHDPVSAAFFVGGASADEGVSVPEGGPREPRGRDAGLWRDATGSPGRLLMFGAKDPPLGGRRQRLARSWTDSRAPPPLGGAAGAQARSPENPSVSAAPN